MKELIRTDRNGTRYYRGTQPCPRCGGKGGSENWRFTGFTCYQCGGSGVVEVEWKEYTPEHEAKLAKARAKRQAKRMAEFEAKQAEYEEKKRLEEEAQKAREEEIKAQKAISQYVGEVGEKITVQVTYLGSPHWTSHIGWMEQTMYAHNFKDADGNVMVWKSGTYPEALREEGKQVLLTGTVKDHSEYKDEKQTVLTRCKIQEV